VALSLSEEFLAEEICDLVHHQLVESSEFRAQEQAEKV